MRRIHAALALAISLFIAVSSQAATTRYLASSGLFPDQICPNWTYHNSSQFPAELLGGNLRLGTGTDGQNQYYSLTPPKFALPSDSLVIQFRARRLDGSTAHTARAPMVVQFQTAAMHGNGLYIGNNEIFVLQADLIRGDQEPVPTSDAMHTYRIVLVGSNFVVYYDGAPKLTGSTFTNSNFFPEPGVSWGEGSSLAHGTSDWEYFEINASATDCAVPMASGSMLAVLGALLLVCASLVVRKRGANAVSMLSISA